jgi:hypothetical protein
VALGGSAVPAVDVDGSGVADGDADVGTDSGAEADADTDAGGSRAEADADADADADARAEADADGDARAEADADADADGAADVGRFACPRAASATKKQPANASIAIHAIRGKLVRRDAGTTLAFTGWGAQVKLCFGRFRGTPTRPLS